MRSSRPCRRCPTRLPCWSCTATGYGRIVRDAEGRVAAIVEQKDADEEQRRIRVVNTGIIAAESTALKRWLVHLSNDNAQGEYYLTDVFAAAASEFSAASSLSVSPGSGANSCSPPPFSSHSRLE